MIAILQFDAASLTHLEKLLAEGHLPALAALRNRGAWYDLDTPATHFEGAAAYSLYTGMGLGEHGLYYPWLWSAAEQRVRFFDDFPAPEVVEALLRRESFDLLWISLSAAHLGGHRFFDVSQLSEKLELGRYNGLATALEDIYRSVDQALSCLIAALPAGTDVIVVSPSGMGPNTSRSHLLPGMLDAVLSDTVHGSKRAPTGSSLWRIRSIVPTNLRAWIARALPDLWALELAARLELRDVNWANTKGFMMPNDDAGYIRLNSRGRERDGIVEPVDADALLDRIATGLQTFRDIDGRPVIQKSFRTRDLSFDGPYTTQLPDLIVQWSDRVVTTLAGVTSSRFGEVAAPGWGTGRTGCHTADAWALVVPASSELCKPRRRPHIVDIVPTVCAALGLDRVGLHGQPLLQSPISKSAV